MKKYIKTKKNQYWKKWRKKLAKHTFSRFQCIIQITIFLHYLGCTLSDCIIILSGKILQLEIFFSQSWDMSGLDPFRVRSNLANKTLTTHANSLFEGVNHIVFTRSTDEKKTTSSNSLYFWSYGPISSYFWVQPPFMAMFLDHSSWTTTQISCFRIFFTLF